MDQMQSMLKVTSPQTLREFVYEYAQLNAEFANALNARFSKPDFDCEVEKISLIAEKAIEDALDDRPRWGEIDLDLSDTSEEIAQRISIGQYTLAFAQAATVYEKVLEIISQEAKNEISDIVNSFAGMLEDISLKVGNSGNAEESEYVFGRSLKCAETVTGNDELDLANVKRMVKMAANVVGESRRKEFDATVRAYSQEYGNNGDFAFARLRATRRLDGQAAAEAFVAKNLDYDEIRMVAYGEAMEEGDWEKAEKLCLELTETDSRSKTAWTVCLFDAYEAAGNTSQSAQVAEDLLFLGSKDHYDRLKAIHQDLGDWESVYPRILQAVKTRMDSATYMEILGKENELALLLDEVQSNPLEVYNYGAQLAVAYPKEVSALFSDHITKESEQANTRIAYAEICERIAEFCQSGLAEQAFSLIGELKFTYRKQPAFIDELYKVELRLSSAE